MASGLPRCVVVTCGFEGNEDDIKECDSCEQHFCVAHLQQGSHSCEKAGLAETRDYVCPLCNQTIMATAEVPVAEKAKQCVRDWTEVKEATPGANVFKFGGVELSNDVSVLQKQLVLVHSQMSIEMSHQESLQNQIKTLTSKLEKVRGTEEERSALKDQIKIQEKELTFLQNDGKNLRAIITQQTLDSKQEMANHKKTVMNLTNDIANLKNDNNEFLKRNETSELEGKRASKLIMSLQAKLFEQTQDLEKASKERNACEELRLHAIAKQKETCVLGELYQQTKEKYEALNSNFFIKSSDSQLEMEIDVLKRERDRDKKFVDEKIRASDMYSRKCQELEKLVAKKDGEIHNLSETLKRQANESKSRLEAERQRVNGLEKVVMRLEEHILKLYADLGLEKHLKRLQDLQFSTSHEYDSDSTEFMSPDRHVLSSGSSGLNNGQRSLETRSSSDNHDAMQLSVDPSSHESELSGGSVN